MYVHYGPTDLPQQKNTDCSVGANGYWSGVLTSNGSRQNTQSLAILTGFLAGGTESVVVTPFELVKIRLQDKSTNFAGPMDVIRHAARTEGVMSLYKGMEATFWRHWWWNGGYFGAIFGVKGLLPKATVSYRTDHVVGYMGRKLTAPDQARGIG